MRLTPVLMPVLIPGYLALLSLSGLLAGAALADPVTPTASDAATRMQSIQGPPGKLTEQGRKLIHASARFHRREIAAARRVLEQRTDPAVRDYAERLILDLLLADEQLRTLAAMHDIELEPLPSADSAEGFAEDDADQEQARSGDSGDEQSPNDAFLGRRADAYEDRLQQLHRHRDLVTEPNLRGYLEAAIPVADTHLKIARRLRGTPGDSDATALIERGEYLARAGDCLSCHTREGGQPYAGGRPLPTPLGGVIYSSNITPSEQGIGGFDEADFIKAMHRGLSPSGDPYYPAFPYPSYTKVSTDDLRAIWAYLDRLPPSDYVPPEHELPWPLSVREALYGWRALFFEPGRFEPDSGKSETWNRGAYLVQGLGHCGACHTPRNAAGAKIDREALSGAFRDGWYAPNLTPNPDQGIGELSVDELVELMQTGMATPVGGDQKRSPDRAAQALMDNSLSEERLADLMQHGPDGDAERDDQRQRPGPQVAAMGPMAEVVHKSLSYLTREDLHAIAVYLKDLPPQETTVESAGKAVTPAEDLYALGEDLYMGRCAACHRPHGEGEPPYVPSLKHNRMLDEPVPNNTVMAILAGAPAEASQAFSPYVRMPAFAEDLSDLEVAAVASYLRERWGDADEPLVPVEVPGQLREHLKSTRRPRGTVPANGPRPEDQ